MAPGTAQAEQLLLHTAQRRRARDCRHAWGLSAAVLLLLLPSAAGLLPPMMFCATPPETVPLTLLSGAQEKGAGTPPSSRRTILDSTVHSSRINLSSVCLDGTPPGYHLQRGSGTGANNWLIHLQVGSLTHPFSYSLYTLLYMLSLATSKTKKSRMTSSYNIIKPIKRR